MITSNCGKKPPRSSLKLAFDPVDDTSDAIVSSKSLNRRVSFSQYVFVLGDEDDDSQMCVSRFNSNITVEDEFVINSNTTTTTTTTTTTANTTDNKNNNNYNRDNNDNNISNNFNDDMESVTSINSSDVSMGLSPNPCLQQINPIELTNEQQEQQNTNMEIENDADAHADASTLKSITICSPDEVISVQNNQLNSTPTHHHDISDMELQNSPCPLAINDDLCNMSIISNHNIDDDDIQLPVQNDKKMDKNSPSKHDTQLFNRSTCENTEKTSTPSFKSPHPFVPYTNTLCMTTDDVPMHPSSLLSCKRPASVVKMPLINLNFNNNNNSQSLIKRKCNNNHHHQLDVISKTPKVTESERITFVSLINTPLRQANLNGDDDDDGVFHCTSVKKKNKCRNFRDISEYKTERLLSSTKRLHNHLHSQLIDCQLEAVLDDIEYDLSTPASIVNFLRKNRYIDFSNLENLDKTTLLTNIEQQYGLDEYLQLQNQFDLHLYDKFMKRRFVIETENIDRFEFWKRLYRERISTVLVSPQLKSVLKKISEMEPIEHLKFMAGAHQLLHNCSKFALQEIYPIIDENIAARNSELNLEITNLKQLNTYLELLINEKQNELKKKQQEQKQWEELENYAKDALKKLDRIQQGIHQTTQHQLQLRHSNEKLLHHKNKLQLKLKQLLEKKSNQEQVDNLSNLLNRSIGCTELFPIPIDEALRNQRQHHNTDDEKCRVESILNTRKMINLFSPCRITCTSMDSENHTYEISTLFGLVNFLLTCQVCQTFMTTSGVGGDDDMHRKSQRKTKRKKQKNDHDKIDGVDVDVDEDDEDDDVVVNVDDDGDYDKNDDEDDDDDMQVTIDPEQLKVISLQVTAPTESRLCLSLLLLYDGITVKFSTRSYRLMVRFTLMSLDYMDSSQGSVEFEVLRGNLNTIKLTEYFNTCKPTCGHLYSIVTNLQSYLSSSSS
ncbi:unnamed protein product [Schistosoma turkestanicum]|nr:unnamed protein product [Schistosoma turkestanicum]